jgi:hypothetical protein
MFTSCGRRIGDRCYSFLAPRDCTRPGISVVCIAGKLSLLLLQNSGAMSVDGFWHRRLRAKSAFTFPEQAARFPPQSYEPVQNLLRRMKTAASLSWARPRSETRNTIVRRLPSFNRANDAFAGLPRFGKNQPPTRQLLSSQRAGLKSGLGRFCVMDASLCIQSVPKG